MINKEDILRTNNFILTSSRDVNEVVRKVLELQSQSLLIHIISFMHNTVLVQNLKQELEKKVPNSKLIMLKHNDKSQTSLVVYELNKEVDSNNISDEVLKELNLKENSKTQELKNCKKQLLSRYFTDH